MSLDDMRWSSCSARLPPRPFSSSFRGALRSCCRRSCSSYFAVEQPRSRRPAQRPPGSLGSLYVGDPNPQRDWIDRAVGRDANVVVALVGRTATVHGLGERVLQPQRRAGLRPRRAAPGRPAGDVRAARRGDGSNRGSERQADPRPVRVHRQLGGLARLGAGRGVTRRSGSSRCRVDGPARARDTRGRALSARHVVPVSVRLQAPIELLPAGAVGCCSEPTEALSLGTRP